MINEVQAYFDAVEQLNADYNEAHNQADRERDAALAKLTGNYSRRTTVVTVHDSRVTALKSVREARRNAAWVEMLLSDDKLVAYIANNYGSNRREYAEMVLKELPLDVAGLRALARKQAWCGEFYRQMHQALRAGVIEDGRSDARKALDDWFSRNISYDYAETLLKLVDAVVAEEAPAWVAAHPDGAKPEPDTSDEDDEDIEDEEDDEDEDE